jgi:hypothetical protein
LLDNLMLTKDDLADAGANQAEAAAQRLDLSDEVGGAGVDGSGGRQRRGSSFKRLDRCEPDAKARFRQFPMIGREPALRLPIDCGDLDMRIARDGAWYYRGSPIGRLALVKLFASVLRREADGSYWLVTPAERGHIEVEDVPFLAVELTATGAGRDGTLIFRTNLDDIVTAGPDHPLRVETAANGEPAPYILVRGGLEARLARPVFYQLVERAAEESIGAEGQFGVWSSGVFFRLGDPGEDWE